MQYVHIYNDARGLMPTKYEHKNGAFIAWRQSEYRQRA